jgi:hypothetical protein
MARKNPDRFEPYSQFIRTLVAGEYVHINVTDETMENAAKKFSINMMCL